MKLHPWLCSKAALRRSSAVAHLPRTPPRPSSSRLPPTPRGRRRGAACVSHCDTLLYSSARTAGHNVFDIYDRAIAPYSRARDAPHSG